MPGKGPHQPSKSKLPWTFARKEIQLTVNQLLLAYERGQQMTSAAPTVTLCLRLLRPEALRGPNSMAPSVHSLKHMPHTGVARHEKDTSAEPVGMTHSTQRAVC